MKYSRSFVFLAGLLVIGFFAYLKSSKTSAPFNGFRDAPTELSSRDAAKDILENIKSMKDRRIVRPVPVSKTDEIDPNTINIEKFIDKVGMGMAYLDGKEAWRSQRPCTLVKTDYDTESTASDVLVIAFNGPRSKDSQFGYHVKGHKGTFWEKEPIFFLNRKMIVSSDDHGAVTYMPSTTPWGLSAAFTISGNSIGLREESQARNGTSTAVTTICTAIK